MISQQRLLLYILVAVFLVTMTLAVSAEADTKKATPPPPEKPLDDPPRPAPEAKPAQVLKEFPSYRHPVGHFRRNLVIAPGPNLEALVALAKRLHREDPETSFRIFTDGNAQQFRRYMLWDLHYSKADSARYPYPEAWANHHNIAVIHTFRYREGWKWQLEVIRGRALVPPLEPVLTVDLE